MGNGCSNDGENSQHRNASVAVVDDAEILFVGRRAAHEEVILSPDEVLKRQRNSCSSSSSPNDIDNSISSSPETDRSKGKKAIAQLVRSFVKGRNVWVISPGGTSSECVAFLNRDLSELRLQRKHPCCGVQVIPLESVLETTAENEAGTVLNPPKKRTIRMRLEARQEALLLQLDNMEDCDFFVACIRACANHQRAVASQRRQLADDDCAPGQDSVVRAVEILNQPSSMSSDSNFNRDMSSNAFDSSRSPERETSPSVCDSTRSPGCEDSTCDSARTPQQHQFNGTPQRAKV